MPATATHDRHDDLLLLAAVLDGDQSAAGAFVRRYNDLIEMAVRVVFRRAGYRPPEEDVRDIVADVWLQLFERDKRCLRRFEPERQVQVGTWLSVLARNKTIDRLRTRRDRFVSTLSAPQLEAHAGNVPPPSEHVEDRERHKVARAAFSQLRSSDRRFLEAWYLEDRPPEELADEFGIAVGTVYSRRYKIQEKLARVVDRMIGRQGARPLARQPALH